MLHTFSDHVDAKQSLRVHSSLLEGTLIYVELRQLPCVQLQARVFASKNTVLEANAEVLQYTCLITYAAAGIQEGE